MPVIQHMLYACQWQALSSHHGLLALEKNPSLSESERGYSLIHRVFIEYILCSGLCGHKD